MILLRIKMMLPFFIISFGILTRLIPHIPNFSPELVFALYLGMKSPKHLLCLYIFLMALISDALISWQHPDFSNVGDWTPFTYSALLGIGGMGLLIKKKGFGLVFMTMSGVATLAYWIWTNFGTWLTTHLYPHSFEGLIMCYLVALPFLGNALAASVAWCAIIVWCETYIPKKNVYEPT